MQIKLDRRLQRCASLVRGRVLLDIGTDHAYLPCRLVVDGVCDSAVAADIGEGPLRAAENTVLRSGVCGKVHLVRSDGFKYIPARLLESVTDVVIAGMGGELIADILDGRGRLPGGVNFILQPNSRAEILRAYLSENGFYTSSETAVKDGRFIYSVICGSFCAEPKKLNAFEARVGHIDPSLPEGREYILNEAERLKTAANGMIASEDETKRQKGGDLLLLVKMMTEYVKQGDQK